MSSQMEIDKEAEIIESVRLRPYLYDLKTQGYKDPIQKANAWKSIATDLDSPGFDAKACEALWTKVKKQYTAFLRKRKLPTGSSSQADVFFRHEKAMEFYSDHYRPYKSISNVPNNFAENSFPEAQGSPQIMESENNSIEFSFEGFEADVVQPEVVILPSCTTPKTPVLSNKRRRIQIDPLEEQLVRALAESKPNDMDEFELFCSSLAPKLRRLANKCPRKAALLQIKVQELFVSAEFDD